MAPTFTVSSWPSHALRSIREFPKFRSPSTCSARPWTSFSKVWCFRYFLCRDHTWHSLWTSIEEPFLAHPSKEFRGVRGGRGKEHIQLSQHKTISILYTPASLIPTPTSHPQQESQGTGPEVGLPGCWWGLCRTHHRLWAASR